MTMRIITVKYLNNVYYLKTTGKSLEEIQLLEAQDQLITIYSTKRKNKLKGSRTVKFNEIELLN